MKITILDTIPGEEDEIIIKCQNLSEDIQNLLQKLKQGNTKIAGHNEDGIHLLEPDEIYYFETVGFLLTALCVPLSLKLFSLVLKKKIDHMTITLALKRYVQWNIVRLGVLEVAIVVNLLCYYLTLSNTGNLCMLIGLTASLFCLPSEKRLRNELHIAKEEKL